MNPEIKAEWVKALRSGEYKQGSGYLHSDGEYCCLGVLTDLYIKHHPQSKWIPGATEECAHRFSLDGTQPHPQDDQEITPTAVADWADFPSTQSEPGRRYLDPEVELNTLRGNRRLSQLNDDGRMFAQIADLIEEQL